MLKPERVIALDSIVGEDDTDTRLLREMADKAERYILSFAWCLQLKEGFFADGFGGVLAIFLFRADISNLGQDQWTWVFVGDIPSAYLEKDRDYGSPQDAFKRYIEGLDEWVAAARAGRSLRGLIPIEARTDFETTNAISRRADTLRQHILPHISNNRFHPGPQSQQ
ncbi:hypothetical protein [Tunturibacter empetritectus]|uniref:Uncharacterized protein n=1 Tax=Tunturiibacter lichenicola TaxID=2051959 RepID=A0A7W8J7Z3_9BACT|nr:hypothetical protein [Edaphobacter lichenicola]MBB5344274.1 hypothetical protein [Edaphobacter lichenicola]